MIGTETTEDVAELGKALESASTVISPNTPPATSPAAVDSPPTPPATPSTTPAPSTLPAETTPAPTAPATPAANTSPATPPTDTAPGEQVVELNQFFGGKYTSLEEVESALKEYETKVEEAYKNPRFASDRAKMLFEYANKFEGTEMEAFKQFLHVQDVATRLDKLSDQQLRFEAFKLDPLYQGKGISEDELRELFIDEEMQKFGNAEDKENPPTAAQITRAKLATTDAKGKISKMKSEFDAAKTAVETPEQILDKRQKLQSSAEQALSGFKGIQFDVHALGENGEKLDNKFNFALEKPEQLKAILDGTVNPQEMWEKVLVQEGIVDVATGNVDMRKFGERVAHFLYAKEMLAEAFNQGHKEGIAYKVKNQRNPAPPAAPGGPPAAPAEPKNDKEGLAMAAFKTVGQ